MSICAIPPLTLFHAASEQDNERVSIASEIDAIAGAVIDAVLQYAAADGLRVGKIAGFQSCNCYGYFRRSAGFDPAKP